VGGSNPDPLTLFLGHDLFLKQCTKDGNLDSVETTIIPEEDLRARNSENTRHPFQRSPQRFNLNKYL
jgi:hypothetical protein